MSVKLLMKRCRNIDERQTDGCYVNEKPYERKTENVQETADTGKIYQI